MIEIKFIGRGGQGGKTAAYLTAKAAFEGGKDVQAFPEFGPEREGAPVYAYTRISDKPIKLHSGIINPDIVVILDESLLNELDVCEGIKKDGIIIINTSKQGIRSIIGEGCKLYTISASEIAIKHLGKNIPNTSMLGALCKVSGLFPFKALKRAFKDELGHKLKPEVFKQNISAMLEAFNGVSKA